MISDITSAKGAALDRSAEIGTRYNAIFWLRNEKSLDAAQAIIEVVQGSGDSELLQHDAVYILGQMGHKEVVEFLISVLGDEKYSAIVRHEAGEALANFPEQKDKILPELRRFEDSPVEVISSTAKLAIAKLERFDPSNNGYNKTVVGTIEPAEPLSEEKLSALLKEKGLAREQTPALLLDPSVEEFTKYGVLYYFRNAYSPLGEKAILTLLDAQNRDKTSALIRHETCFVLGQLDSSARSETLRAGLQTCVRDPSENPIVRHEAVLAYAAIFGEDQFIEETKKDPEPMVAESAKCLQ